jgi:hypothetical protein
LQVQIGILDAVELIAPQCTTHAEFAAGEILESEPALALPVRVEPEHQLQRLARQLRLEAPARVDSAEIAVQVDHAAATERVGLRRHRHGEELHDAAFTGMQLHSQAAGRGSVVLPNQPELLVAYRLARVEQQCGGRGLARIRVHLRLGESERVLRLRRIEPVRHEHEAIARAGRILQPRIEGLARGRAVLAPAAGAEVRVVEHVVECSLRAAPVEGFALAVVAARNQPEAPARRVGAVGGEHLDDAAGGVAVERGEGPAQHLDACGGCEVEVRHLSLSVGHGRRDAVEEQADAADAESGARAEAADRHLQVLRVVLPLAREQAGHLLQFFRQVHAESRSCQRFAPDHRHRRRHFARGFWHARCSHLHGGQPGRPRRRRFGAGQSGNQQQAEDARLHHRILREGAAPAGAPDAVRVHLRASFACGGGWATP